MFKVTTEFSSKSGVLRIIESYMRRTLESALKSASEPFDLHKGMELKRFEVVRI